MVLFPAVSHKGAAVFFVCYTTYMKLSFVIPAHNEQAVIKQCLESVIKEIGLRQDCEIIVVNNASTDKTKSIAQSFPGVKVVDEPRKGLSQARQTGMENSSGELIANVDADTIMPQGWLEKVLQMFEQDSKLVGVSGPQVFFDSPPLIRFWIKLYYYFAYVSYLVNSKILRVGALLQGGNYVVKRKAMEAIGGFNPKFEFYGEDVDIARRLYKQGKIIFTLKLPIYASGRRVNKDGILRMAFVYPINYFWTIFFGRPFTKDYTNIRVD